MGGLGQSLFFFMWLNARWGGGLQLSTRDNEGKEAD